MMTEAAPEQELSEAEAKAVGLWRQGDYTLDIHEFPVLHMDEEGPYAEIDEVAGLVVLSQTCDIVNIVPGRNFVVVAPLVEVTDDRLVEEASTGATPAAATLATPPSANHVVDLTRTTTIHKSMLARLERRDGFAAGSDIAIFAQSLERRYGRFAFPNELNPPLSALRSQAKSRHGKDSDIGRIYRSIHSFRVAASPNFDTRGAAIRITAVLTDPDKMQASREMILKELNALGDAPKFKWPAEFVKANPFFVAKNRDEITAREWTSSMHVDLDFISRST